jgi:hypothetical protein
MVIWCGGALLCCRPRGDTLSPQFAPASCSLVCSGTRLGVAAEMYRMRFDEALPEGLSLRELRGNEGIRVRETYAKMSRDTRGIKEFSLYALDPATIDLCLSLFPPGRSFESTKPPSKCIPWSTCTATSPRSSVSWMARLTTLTFSMKTFPRSAHSTSWIACHVIQKVTGAH